MLALQGKHQGIRLPDPFSLPYFWVVLAALISSALFLSTAQLHINGSNHAYATDVGEIQNALPRWGTIHHSGYPLYTAVGSLFVTVLGWIGVPPAAGASFFSAVFGAISIGMIVLLGLETGISGPSAAVGALAVAVCTSIWVDASLAEVHTVTLAFSVITLFFAMRLGRMGSRTDLLLLTFFLTQSVAHQRSAILLAPAVLILIGPHWRGIWRNFRAVLLVTLLAPLTYLYLPLRVWMGADWVFGAPASWDGFWTLFLDNRAGRVFEMQNNLAEWWLRINTTVKILADDLFWPLLLLGLVSVTFMVFDKQRRRAGIAFFLTWVAYFMLTVLIWRNRVVDAQLAAKLPVLIIAGLGLAYFLDQVKRRSQRVGTAATILLLLILIFWAARAREFTLSITRDRSVESVIATVDRVKPFGDGRQTTITVPWGRDYWGLTYAQAYRNQLQGLNLVDHNANPRDIVARGDHLLAPLATFYVFPIEWWEDFLGQSLHLSTAAPGVVEMSRAPVLSAEDVPLDVAHELNNGIRIRSVSITDLNENQKQIIVYWESLEKVSKDYSVAVHLVAKEPPLSEADILYQADNNHPVEGYYPTTLWQPGEIVRDDYLIEIPEGAHPAAIRLGMYRSDAEEGFINSPWLTLSLEAEP
jgi:hypothetical protein